MADTSGFWVSPHPSRMIKITFLPMTVSTLKN
jgi:hypothetical protein